MRIPSFSELSKEAALAGQPIYRSFALGMHPNPFFYKHEWRVFWRGSPTDGKDFFQDQYLMCTAHTMTLKTELEARGESYWLYGGGRPRLDPGRCPFDIHHPRWAKTNWAPAYEQDSDPEWLSPWGVTYK